MVKLTENILYNKVKCGTDNIKRLNLWGCDLDDISICSTLKNVEVLSLSVNKISSLQSLAHCHRLKELYLRKNEVESFDQIDHLKELCQLKVLWLEENPIAHRSNYRLRIIRALPHLAMLDNKSVSKRELDYAKSLPLETLLPEEDTLQIPPLMISSTVSLQNTPRTPKHLSLLSERDQPKQSSIYENIEAESSEMEFQTIEDSGDQTPTVDMVNVAQRMQTENRQSMMTTSQLIESVPHNFRKKSKNVDPMTRSSIEIFQPQSDGNEDCWEDFGFESAPESSQRMHSPADMMSRSVMIGPNVSRKNFSTLPRSKAPPRSQSSSPFVNKRSNRILAAIESLIEELDQRELRIVIDLAQKKIKKER